MGEGVAKIFSQACGCGEAIGDLIDSIIIDVWIMELSLYEIRLTSNINDSRNSNTTTHSQSFKHE